MRSFKKLIQLSMEIILPPNFASPASLTSMLSQLLPLSLIKINIKSIKGQDRIRGLLHGSFVQYIFIMSLQCVKY